MSKKKGGVIGFDPLAWMKQPDAADAADAPKAVADSRPEPAAAPAAVAASAPVAAEAPVASAKPAAEEPVVALGEMITIEQATSLHETLRARLSAAEVQVDAGSVRRVDAAGLQVLLAFVREHGRRGQRVTWRGVSTPLRDAAALLGLESSLNWS